MGDFYIENEEKPQTYLSFLSYYVHETIFLSKPSVLIFLSLKLSSL